MSGSDWETERDQAVQLLNDAADRLEQLAGLAIVGPWSASGQVVYSGRDDDFAVASASTGTTALWVASMSPDVAPFLAGWLRSVARIAAVQEFRDGLEVYVDRKALGLAQHVMGVAR